MRILYMHRSMGDGGEGVHIRAMINAFRGRGHEVEVHAPGGDSIDDPGAVSGRTRISSMLNVVPVAARELGEIAYGLLDGQRAAARARSVAPDLVYARHAIYTAACVRAARAANAPLLLEVNSPLTLERSDDELRGLRFAPLARRWERRCFDAADRLLVVSTPLKRYLQEQGVVTPIDVVPNGIDPSVYEQQPARCEVRERLGIDPAAIVVGFVGFIRVWHGVDRLLQAASAVASRTGVPLAVLVVGDGPALAELQESAHALAAPAQAIFTGRVAHASIPDYLSAMDVTVSPRSTFYACPLKLIEYMAAGTAVVAPHADNILDVLRPEQDGLTFEPGNDAGLREALDRVVVDHDLRARLGATARARALTELTWAGNARRVEAMVGPAGERPETLKDARAA